MEPSSRVILSQVRDLSYKHEYIVRCRYYLKQGLNKSIKILYQLILYIGEDKLGLLHLDFYFNQSVNIVFFSTYKKFNYKKEIRWSLDSNVPLVHWGFDLCLSTDVLLCSVIINMWTPSSRSTVFSKLFNDLRFTRSYVLILRASPTYMLVQLWENVQKESR